VILPESTIFGNKDLGEICNIEDIDQIITDSGISANTVNQLQSVGLTLIIVD
jgi:DeoR family transcriptional regulator of aga operon